MFVTEETSQFEMFWLNDVAPLNIANMVVTEETSQVDKSPLKDDASMNI
eukprot:CAMPEP_0113653300 /NCGR_PEP_ID=MMETSP0017_2-20120614/28502_1 /TAXON_ID=2856 /ORGANISM="Cylindrotheca closterium" /LENGTH=48 /DNA_ID=CAMNT_0000566277 /DNA_START=40 /DNA_END=186 /DNA_ORIENTATION=- /assembly_acc=CAM_ASM_000147